jgi:hypothetical protein
LRNRMPPGIMRSSLPCGTSRNNSSQDSLATVLFAMPQDRKLGVFTPGSRFR